MKSTISKKLFLFLFGLVLLSSCSKDNPQEQPQDTYVSPAAEFENGTVYDIVDNSDVSSSLNVTASGKIKDASKVFIDLNIYHSYLNDITAELIAPDGTSTAIIKRKTSSDLNNDYIADYVLLAANTLSFNSLFIEPSPYANPLLAGNYGQLLGATSQEPFAVVKIPLGTFLNGKNVAGTWTMKIYDSQSIHTGKLHKFKIRFGAGSLTGVNIN